METTTLEQAAESLLAPGPETETEESNLSEVEEEITEPTDDGQGEVVEAEAESVDDADTSSDDDFDDVEIDDLDQVEATGDTTLIPVKVDGKDEMWTLDQLKQSAAGQAAINKRVVCSPLPRRPGTCLPVTLLGTWKPSCSTTRVRLSTTKTNNTSHI